MRYLSIVLCIVSLNLACTLARADEIAPQPSSLSMDKVRGHTRIMPLRQAATSRFMSLHSLPAGDDASQHACYGAGPAFIAAQCQRCCDASCHAVISPRMDSRPATPSAHSELSEEKARQILSIFPSAD